MWNFNPYIMTKPISRCQNSLFIILGIILPAAQALAATNPDSPANHPLNPLGDASGGAPELYGRVIRGLLGFAGVGALLFFIWGGIVLLTSRGNSEKVKQGRDTLVWAVIGLLVCFSSYIILRFVLESIMARE